jgi:hypothetical protein
MAMDSENETACPRCGRMTRAVAGFCSDCGGVKVAGSMPAEERYRPGLLFDGDDDLLGWLNVSWSLSGALLIIVAVAGLVLIFMLL